MLAEGTSTKTDRLETIRQVERRIQFGMLGTQICRGGTRHEVVKVARRLDRVAPRGPWKGLPPLCARGEICIFSEGPDPVGIFERAQWLQCEDCAVAANRRLEEEEEDI